MCHYEYQHCIKRGFHFSCIVLLFIFVILYASCYDYIKFCRHDNKHYMSNNSLNIAAVQMVKGSCSGHINSAYMSDNKVQDGIQLKDAKIDHEATKEKEKAHNVKEGQENKRFATPGLVDHLFITI